MILTKTLDLSPQRTETSPQAATPKTVRQFRQSSALIACALFAFLNFGGMVAYSHSLKSWNSAPVVAARETGEFDPTKCLHDLPMFFWTLQNGFERTLDAKVHKLTATKTPDVVLLGSSLMIFPLWFADHGDNLPDQAYYSFQSKALENRIPHADKVCNLSLALLNASDAERLVETHLTGAQRPNVLVYGVGPRDFYDALIEKPDTSVYFDSLSTLDDFTGNSKTYFRTPYDEALCLGRRAYFLFSKRNDIIGLGKSIVKQTLHLNKPTVIVPLTDMGTQRNLEEYQGHYRNISAKALSRQLKFLDQLLTVCTNRNIRVILLSMPLTPENRDLIPTQVYDGFNQQLAALATSNKQTFMNLNDTKFNTCDFLDSAHLNARGANKFVDLIAPSIDAALVSAKRTPE